jgi:hypothetical protein
MKKLVLALLLTAACGPDTDPPGPAGDAGTNGTNGKNGYNTRAQVTPYAQLSTCNYGPGEIVILYLDVNGDGVFDGPDITEGTYTVCTYAPTAKVQVTNVASLAACKGGPGEVVVVYLDTNNNGTYDGPVADVLLSTYAVCVPLPDGGTP